MDRLWLDRPGRLQGFPVPALLWGWAILSGVAALLAGILL